MAKPISVKVSREKLLASLKKALAEREKSVADYEKAESDHEQEMKDWQTKVAEAVKAGKVKVSEVSHSRNWRDETEEALIRVVLPAGLRPPKKREPKNARPEYQLKSELDELTNAIAILTMCEDEMVGTSTYAGVARYIK